VIVSREQIAPSRGVDRSQPVAIPGNLRYIHASLLRDRIQIIEMKFLEV